MPKINDLNTTSWIPTRATALPVQYLAELNQLSTNSAAGAAAHRHADPTFLNQLRMPNATAESTKSQAASAGTISPQNERNGEKASQGMQLLDSLRGQSATALKLEQRPTAFEYDPKEVASGQLESEPESAEQAMQQFVGETFYGMLMKQMRNTVVQSDLFGNSSAKRMFESQLDQTLVQELATNHSEFLSRPIRI